MKNHFLLILIFISVSSCKSKGNDGNDVPVQKYEPISTNKVVDWKHPDFFEFQNYQEYRISDTIRLDLNGNDIIEEIYFDKKVCPKLIISEKGKEIVSIGCGNEEYPGFPNAIGWVDLWCVVSDIETYEIIVEDGELIGQKTVKLERPSLYIGKAEAGGGIITYRDGDLHWIHQSD